MKDLNKILNKYMKLEVTLIFSAFFTLALKLSLETQLLNPLLLVLMMIIPGYYLFVNYYTSNYGGLGMKFNLITLQFSLINVSYIGVLSNVMSWPMSKVVLLVSVIGNLIFLLLNLFVFEKKEKFMIYRLAFAFFISILFIYI